MVLLDYCRRTPYFLWKVEAETSDVFAALILFALFTEYFFNLLSSGQKAVKRERDRLGLHG
jgi:hypothetical protein